MNINKIINYQKILQNQFSKGKISKKEYKKELKYIRKIKSSI